MFLKSSAFCSELIKNNRNNINIVPGKCAEDLSTVCSPDGQPPYNVVIAAYRPSSIFDFLNVKAISFFLLSGVNMKVSV